MRALAILLVVSLPIAACSTAEIRETVSAGFDRVANLGAPSDPPLTRALELARQQKWEELRTHCQAWVQKEPKRPEAWAELGYVEVQLGHFPEGLAASQKATELRPDYAEAWNNAGVALTRLGRVDEAAAAFRKAAVVEGQR